MAQSKQVSRSTETRFWAMKAALLAVVVVALAGIALHMGSNRSASSEPASAASPSAAPALIPASYSAPQQPAHPVSASSLSFPLFFEPNVGQTDSRVKFLARGAGYGLFLTSDEAVLSLQRPELKTRAAVSRGGKTKLVADVVRMYLDGADSATSIVGSDPLSGRTSYFIGKDRSKWRSGIQQYGRVEYERVYPGVDLVYYGNQQQLEYDFRVASGADPNQIALSFKGASARIDSGDLILATADGDIRFHAPHIYQPAAKDRTAADVTGGFRKLAENRFGFSIGAYDHSRELVIDPVLSYSTFLGGGGEYCPAPGATGPGQSTTLGCPQIAVDFANNIYIAGSTSSANFPVTAGALQTTLAGAQNIFVAVLNPSASPSAQLLFATYLGGSGTDSLGGIAIDPGQASFPVSAGQQGINIYVAGTTSSQNFPTTSNAFQTSATWTIPNQTHGFVSAINVAAPASSGGADTFTLKYSSYLAGNNIDSVTGVAVDPYFDAYVTGTTTSTNILTGFPSTANAYQICPWQPAASGGTPCPITTGPTQFFASEISTGNTGPQSMLYSTYFGGGYSSDPANAAIGGGVAVDVISNNPHSNVNMYFTGTTNMWGDGVTIPNGASPFPLINAWQSCLNQSGATGSPTSPCNAPGTNTDAFVVKLNPNQVGAAPSYSTFLGGSGNDNGIAVAPDTIGNAYVTGSTNSSDWNCVFNSNSCTLAPAPYNAYTGTGGATNAFIGKVSNQLGTIFPLVFFAYVGGSGPDAGNAIAIDSVQSAHIAGTTSSTNLNLSDPYQATYGGGASDAFVASISSTLTTPPTGNYVTYLGGSGLDEGTGIALDVNGSAYVAGVTQSSNFPMANPPNPYQGTLQGTQNAFASKLGSTSTLVLSPASGSPSPSPLPAGTQGTFTFNITNNGPDSAYNVQLLINVPTSGVQNTPTAEVISSGAGSCTNGFNGQILCNVGSLAVGAVGQVAVFVTPSIPQVNSTIGVSAQAAANGGTNVSNTLGQTVNITDFNITATLVTTNIIAGNLVVIDVTLTPNSTLGYNASVTMTQSTSPAMVTNPSPTFIINPVLMSGTSNGTTVLNIQTVPRPVNSGSLLRRRAFYAAWLPIGGLSLAGLGIGATRKRRRWIVGMLLGLLAGLILLQPACSSGSSPVTSGGGTQAGYYQVTITASAGTGASHQAVVSLYVN